VTDGKREADELRDQMTKLDVEILSALDRRARAARQLGELRRDQAALLPLSDHESVRAIVARSSGDMPEDALRAIFGEIQAACLALELPVKIAFVGAEEEPCHAAARGRFGRSASLTGVESTAGALDEVTRKRAEFAVVPFETASDGPVHTTIEALSAGDLRIVEMLERDRIRYAVVCARPSRRTGNDATAIVFKVQDAPGSLLDVLRVFAERGINLTNVHSHPLRELRDEPWIYLFYVEMRGHFTDRPLIGAFEEMKRLARFFKLLGSYPYP
jgi:prephenate dehydratase/chorismate mutase